MEKQAVAVLFGGQSTEHEVSLQSAYAVISALDREQVEPVLVGITRRGEWYWYRGDPCRIPAGTWDTWSGADDCLPVVLSPSRGGGLLVFRDGRTETIHLDAAFPVLHGKNGEDGTVQGLLELAGIPIVGCGSLASAVCMDKEIAHAVARDAGIPVPAFFSVRKGMYNPAQAAAEAEKLGYPLFVKPSRAGSSFGVSRVSGPEGLDAAIRAAFDYDRKAVVEAAVPGFEVGCAIMGAADGPLTIGEVDEIELSQGFFDYEEKYTLKTSRIYMPARISPEAAEKVRQTAEQLYRLLDCDGFARVDCFLTPEGEVVFNEINTIPGLTAHSRFPGMMRGAGMTLPEVVTRLIGEAVK